MDRKDPEPVPDGMEAASPDATAEFDLQATVPRPAGLAAGPGGRLASFPYRQGDVILPGYRLVKQLGRGGFGEVWRAEAPGGLGVAIKILANLGRREGGREYRALQTIKNIRHAHIVPVFGVWLKSGDGRVLSEAELADAERKILTVPRPSAEPEVVSDDGPSPLQSLELVIEIGRAHV